MTVNALICVIFATFSVYVMASPATTMQMQTVRSHKVHSKHQQNRQRHCRKHEAMAPQSMHSQSGKGEEMKKASDFNGDVRNLPKTKPAQRERPRPEDPPVVRRALPT